MNIYIEEILFAKDEVIRCKNDYNDYIDMLILGIDGTDCQCIIPTFKLSVRDGSPIAPRDECRIPAKKYISCNDYYSTLFDFIRGLTSDYKSIYPKPKIIDNLRVYVVMYKNTIGLVSKYNKTLRKLTDIERSEFRNTFGITEI